MIRALLFTFVALSVAGCGPSFWTEVQYFDGRHHLLRPLPDFLVGRSRDWVIQSLGTPDDIDPGVVETLIYRNRDWDLLALQTDEQTTRDDDLLTSYVEGTRFVSGMTLVIEKDTVRDVLLVAYRTGSDESDETLAEIFSDRDKSWIIGQLGPPDVVLPRMGGDTFVYRNRSLDLWVLRVRPTLANNPAIYTRTEGNRYVQRLTIYFDREGIVRNVSFPKGNQH